MTVTTPDRTAEIESILEERVMVLDGSWGVMLQSMGLSEEQYRGERFGDYERDLKGCIDVLVLTQPEIVEDTQRRYLDAGADILTTNTFTSTRFGLSEFGLQSHVYEINRQAARLARNVTDDYSDRTPNRPRFVAGSIGPTNKTLSISPDVNDSGYRDITFDEMVDAYSDAVRGLLDGGAHILLVETVFDTLNARATLYAIESIFEERGARVPVMVSFTAVDLSGRNLSGQTAEAFYASVTHVPLLSVGINCSLGSDQIRPFLVALSNASAHFVACYPNAGLPNEFGEYDESASHMAANLSDFAENGLANIVGSCCGSRPGAYQGDCRCRGGDQAAPEAFGKSEHRSERIGSSRDQGRLQLRQRRRARQRHRLGALQAADSLRQVRGCRVRRQAAGRRRRADTRREHGRGDARLRSRHGEVSQAAGVRT